MRAVVPVLVAILLALPFAAGQAHEHGAAGKGGAVVLRDGPEDGRAVVGGLTHFGFALLDAQGNPVAHQDARFEVVQDGVTVFASEATHEYDGLFGFETTFLKAGPYRVNVTSEGMPWGSFEGVAVEPVYETVASVELDLQQSPGGSVVSALLSIVDGQGALIPHTDALVEVRRAGDQRLVSRFHAHVHEEPIAFQQAFPPGDHVMRVVAYRAFPDGEDPDLRAVVAETPFRVLALPTPAVPALPTAPTPLEPIGATAEKDGYALHATYDPYNQVGVGSPFRLAGVVTGPNATPVPHVDFSFVVTGPAGEVFRSESLHEYDGVFEWVYVPTIPGAYSATLTAKARGVELSVPYQIHALPPAAPLGGGPNTLAIEGLDGLRAGVPANLTFSIRGPSGPLSHSEIDVTISRAGAAPLHQFKLHTHESGDFAATVLFPEEGDWLVHVDAFPLLPQAALVQGPGGPGAPLLFTATVGAGEQIEMDRAGAEADAQARVPGPAVALALLATAGAALVLRRRA